MQSSQQLSERNRVLILVNSCVHILYGISSILLVSAAVNLISNETHADNGILKNWENNMIIDIQSSRYDTCPLGYESMFSFDWPGTISACNCQLWNENPTRPHGPDGEFSQIKQNTHYLSEEDIQEQKELKDSKSNNQGNFIQNQLKKQQVSQEDNHKQQKYQDSKVEGQGDDKKLDLKKQINHPKRNKLDLVNVAFNQPNPYQPSKEELLAKLNKYGLENKIYTEGICNWNQTQAGCLDILPVKQQPFTKWKQRLQWCVARAQAVNMSIMQKYYDYQNGSCKDENLRVCGDPEDKNYQFCFPKSYTQCPINGILITTTPPRGQEQLYYQSRPMQFSRNQLLYVSRNLPKQMPVSNFVVAEDSVCIEDPKNNISKDHQDYYLLKSQRKRCSSNITDDRYLLIDSQGEQSFYYNNFALQYRDQLPGFTLNNTYIYNLYKHQYIYWKHECDEYMSYFLSDKDFDQFYTRQRALKIITYVISIITIIISTFELLLICRVPLVQRFEKLLLQWDPVIVFVLQLIVLPFSAAALHQAIVLYNLENQLQQKQCTDEFTLKLIGTGSIQIHKEIQKFNKGQIIFICLVLLTNAFNFLLTLCCQQSQVAPKKKRRASTY
ncbi:hypothetical protein ABPG72_008352 [Tetrahymena utriculariae]